MGISYLCCNVALDLTTATNVGFLVALPVVFAPLLSTVVERSRYPRAIIPFQVGVAGRPVPSVQPGRAVSPWGRASFWL